MVIHSSLFVNQNIQLPEQMDLLGLLELRRYRLVE